MNDLEKHKNEREAGKLAIALARFTYFGDTVLRQSTLTGRNNMPALDRQKMASLKRDIRSVFPHMSEEDFLTLWGRCLLAISDHMRHARYKFVIRTTNTTTSG